MQSFARTAISWVKIPLSLAGYAISSVWSGRQTPGQTLHQNLKTAISHCNNEQWLLAAMYLKSARESEEKFKTFNIDRALYAALTAVKLKTREKSHESLVLALRKIPCPMLALPADEKQDQKQPASQESKSIALSRIKVINNIFATYEEIIKESLEQALSKKDQYFKPVSGKESLAEIREKLNVSVQVQNDLLTAYYATIAIKFVPQDYSAYVLRHVSLYLAEQPTFNNGIDEVIILWLTASEAQSAKVIEHLAGFLKNGSVFSYVNLMQFYLGYIRWFEAVGEGEKDFVKKYRENAIALHAKANEFLRGSSVAREKYDLLKKELANTGFEDLFSDVILAELKRRRGPEEVKKAPVVAVLPAPSEEIMGMKTVRKAVLACQKNDWKTASKLFDSALWQNNGILKVLGGDEYFYVSIAQFKCGNLENAKRNLLSGIFSPPLETQLDKPALEFIFKQLYEDIQRDINRVSPHWRQGKKTSYTDCKNAAKKTEKLGDLIAAAGYYTIPLATTPLMIECYLDIFYSLFRSNQLTKTMWCACDSAIWLAIANNQAPIAIKYLKKNLEDRPSVSRYVVLMHFYMELITRFKLLKVPNKISEYAIAALALYEKAVIYLKDHAGKEQIEEYHASLLAHNKLPNHFSQEQADELSELVKRYPEKKVASQHSDAKSEARATQVLLPEAPVTKSNTPAINASSQNQPTAEADAKLITITPETQSQNPAASANSAAVDDSKKDNENLAKEKKPKSASKKADKPLTDLGLRPKVKPKNKSKSQQHKSKRNIPQADEAVSNSSHTAFVGTSEQAESSGEAQKVLSDSNSTDDESMNVQRSEQMQSSSEAIPVLSVAFIPTIAISPSTPVAQASVTVSDDPAEKTILQIYAAKKAAIRAREAAKQKEKEAEYKMQEAARKRELEEKAQAAREERERIVLQEQKRKEHKAAIKFVRAFTTDLTRRIIHGYEDKLLEEHKRKAEEAKQQVVRDQKEIAMLMSEITVRVEANLKAEEAKHAAEIQQRIQNRNAILKSGIVTSSALFYQRINNRIAIENKIANDKIAMENKRQSIVQKLKAMRQEIQFVKQPSSIRPAKTIAVPPSLKLIADLIYRCKKYDLHIFLVGGVLRDLLKGKPFQDVDLLLGADYLKLRKVIEHVNAELKADAKAQDSKMPPFSFSVSAMENLNKKEAISQSGRFYSRLCSNNRAFGKPIVLLHNPELYTKGPLADALKRDFTQNSLRGEVDRDKDGNDVIHIHDALGMGIDHIEKNSLQVIDEDQLWLDPIYLLRTITFMARFNDQSTEETQYMYHYYKTLIQKIIANDKMYFHQPYCINSFVDPITNLIWFNCCGKIDQRHLNAFVFNKMVEVPERKAILAVLNDTGVLDVLPDSTVKLLTPRRVVPQFSLTGDKARVRAADTKNHPGQNSAHSPRCSYPNN